MPDKRRFDLIVCDLDGTLVGRDLAVDAHALAQLVVLRQRGIDATIATGRILAAAARYVKEIGVTLPVILYNGAIVLEPHTRRVLFERRIPRSQARAALELLAGHDIDAQLYLNPSDTGYYVERVTPAIEAFTAKDGIPYSQVAALGALLDTDPLKLLLIGPRVELLRYRQRVLQAGLTLETVLSEHNFLELLPSGVSKGAALRHLCAHLGIDIQRVVAFGDNPNDAEMLAAAGCGVAMASGDPQLRAQADLVVDSVAAGLAQLFGLSSSSGPSSGQG